MFLLYRIIYKITGAKSKMNEIKSLLDEWKKIVQEQTNLENTYPTLYILNTYKKQKDSIYKRYIAKLEIMFLEMQKDDITQERFYELIKRTKKILENGKNELSRINELEQSAIKKAGLNFKKQEKLETEMSISYVDKLEDGHKFEEYIAKMLRKLGYSNVEVTPGSGDYGVDVLAKKNDVTYAIQCKHYLSGKVGIEAVQQVFTGKEHYKRHIRSSYNK